MRTRTLKPEEEEGGGRWGGGSPAVDIQRSPAADAGGDRGDGRGCAREGKGGFGGGWAE